MKKISLQWRITLLTGLVLGICAVSLTAVSIYNANRGFSTIARAGVAQTAEANDSFMPAVPAKAIPAESVQPAIELQTAHFAFQSAIWLIAVILGGMAAVYFAVGQALKSVRKLSDKVEEISAGNLSMRLPPAQSHDEVGQLTDGFNQMLERLDEDFERQKRFAQNAAHELKTPLTIMKTSFQVLKMDDTPTMDEYRENADVNSQNVERLIEIVDDLLLLASEAEVDLDDKVELGPLLQVIVDAVEPRYMAQEVDIQLSAGNETVLGDAGLLYTAFANLIENSLKYNRPKGHLYITAKTHTQGTEIMFRDTGIGIPEEVMEKVFEPFYRVDESRSRKIAGSGLGLSITKSILERHHATIKAESSPDHGTKFTVLFP